MRPPYDEIADYANHKLYPTADSGFGIQSNRAKRPSPETLSLIKALKSALVVAYELLDNKEVPTEYEMSGLRQAGDLADNFIKKAV